MMIVPKRNNDLFDDFFDSPLFRGEPIPPHKMMMKTDISENEDSYKISVDLPGFERENIKIDIENGYLNINAKIDSSNDDEKKNYIRKERFVGECSRSFYIGEDIMDEDIKASFKNGVLILNVPKVKEVKRDEKKYIEIDD